MAAGVSVGLLLLLAQLEAGAEVLTEARAGHAPVLAGDAPEAVMAAVLSPAGELRARLAGDTLDLRLNYSPQLHWRYPNQLETSRPLVLHDALFSATSAVSPRTRLGARATLSVGEADYSALPRLLGTMQGALPELLELLVVTAGMDGERDLSPTWKLGLGVTFIHRRPLDAGETATPDTTPMPDPGGSPDPADPSADFLLARQNSIVVQPMLSHRLTARDELRLTSGLARESHSTGIELYRWEPRLDWRRRLDARHDLRVGGGVAYTHETGSRLATGTTSAPSASCAGTAGCCAARGWACAGPPACRSSTTSIRCWRPPVPGACRPGDSICCSGRAGCWRWRPSWAPA
jgi:hypothetical protein